MLHQIGAGALGPVYRAYDPDRDRLAAVKWYRFDLPPDRVHRLVAALEQLVAASLAHPAVALPLATGVVGGSAFLAQDFVAADSLDIVLRERSLSTPAEGVRVTTMLADGLDFAAEAGFPHGMLHPRDVLIAPDAVRLTGIGVAGALERAGVPVPLRRPYSAPERVNGMPWDRRADVFGLAALAYEMLWARRLAASGAEVLDSLTEIPGADLDALADLFARALAHEPLDRFASAREFAEALSAAFSAPSVRTRLQVPVVSPPAAGGTGPGLPFDEAPDDAVPSAEVSEPSIEFFSEVSEPVIGVSNPPSETPEVPFEISQAAEEGPVAAPAVPARSSWTRRHWPLAASLFVGVALGFALRDATLSVPPDAAPPAGAVATGGTDASTGTSGEAAVRSSALRSSDIELKPDPRPVPTIGRAEDRATGQLQVRSSPSGARVFFNGKEIGTSPVTIRDVGQGTHTIRVTRSGYLSQQRRVSVSAAQPTSPLTFELARERAAPAPAAQAAGGSAPLMVESRPPGARVFLDGKLVGTTPLTMSDVPAGAHAVRLDLAGYRPWVSSVRVVAGEPGRVTASLDR